MVSLAREGRSAINVRVNSSVVPQGHTKANVFCKGQEVLVIDGPHRGLCGEIFLLGLGCYNHSPLLVVGCWLLVVGCWLFIAHLWKVCL